MLRRQKLCEEKKLCEKTKCWECEALKLSEQEKCLLDSRRMIDAAYELKTVAAISSFCTELRKEI
jgi:hypothetical protein